MPQALGTGRNHLRAARVGLFAFSILAVGMFVSGCCSSHTDLTQTPEVQSSGVLGRHVRTTQELTLIKDKPSNILFLALKTHLSYSRQKVLGVVEKGTVLRLNQVIRVKELVAILYVLPEYFEWKGTQAVIEDGPFAGQEVIVSGKPLSDEEATLRSEFLADFELTPASK